MAGCPGRICTLRHFLRDGSDSAKIPRFGDGLGRIRRFVYEGGKGFGMAFVLGNLVRRGDFSLTK